MCGRYVITSPPEAMREFFSYLERPNFPARYNVAPTQAVPIIRLEGGQRHFVLVRWGLVPAWAKEIPPTPLINARAETVAEKASFRGAFRHRRALMPADGFYEWQAEGSGPKQPWFIRRRDHRPIAMAAIWDDWMSKDGSEIESCAVVTTEATPTLRTIHHRMPVILDDDAIGRWLDPATPANDLLALMKPAPDEMLEAFPVSTAVNRVANDDPSLVEPIMVAATPASAKKQKPGDKRQIDLF
jgi:putative SOS response-associated peptidase YedK